MAPFVLVKPTGVWGVYSTGGIKDVESFCQGQNNIFTLARPARKLQVLKVTTRFRLESAARFTAMKNEWKSAKKQGGVERRRLATMGKSGQAGLAISRPDLLQRLLFSTPNIRNAFMYGHVEKWYEIKYSDRDERVTPKSCPFAKIINIRVTYMYALLKKYGHEMSSPPAEEIKCSSYKPRVSENNGEDLTGGKGQG